MGSLSFREIRSLCAKMCGLLGVSEVPAWELYRNYFAKIPLPIMLRERGRTLWIDRYYAAYQYEDGEVKYVYVTLKHACEELRACRAAQSRLGQLPPEIAFQLKTALKWMRMHKQTLWRG
ncbi:MAG: hypothetical protein K5663_06370 [Clostridiales bacterium]|nr:hypothetical protein [Clostridiales bacterium]